MGREERGIGPSEAGYPASILYYSTVHVKWLAVVFVGL